MKFKAGDKVKHKRYGFGKIVYINEEEWKNPYAVQFKIFNENLHSLGMFGAPKVKSGHGWWCKECDLELDKQQSHNLIPQIAKMLGVEIGEEFYIEGWTSYKHRFTEYELEAFLTEWTEVDNETYRYVITNVIQIQKLPPKPKLSEAERIILCNLPKAYTYIARDDSGALYIYENKPKKDGSEWFNDYSFESLNLFQDLFQSIKWEDEEPYNIVELLKGE